MKYQMKPTIIQVDEDGRPELSRPGSGLVIRKDAAVVDVEHHRSSDYPDYQRRYERLAAPVEVEGGRDRHEQVSEHEAEGGRGPHPVDHVDRRVAEEDDHKRTEQHQRHDEVDADVRRLVGLM